jgi:hypothetical protein
VDRLPDPDYRAFEVQLRSSGFCARPVRLRGKIEVCDKHRGRRRVWSTDGEPDELLREARGNRREAICGPCAERYRGDAGSWWPLACGTAKAYPVVGRASGGVRDSDGAELRTRACGFLRSL